MSPEEKVTQYFEENPTSTLDYYTDEYESDDCVPYEVAEPDIEEMKNGSIEDAVYIVLQLCINCTSFFNGNYDCHAEANRSSGDIWRHLKKYRPDVTIFEVMRALYELSANEIIGCDYCDGIRKRVFWGYGSSTYGFTIIDEYGLEFDEWTNIGEIKK